MCFLVYFKNVNSNQEYITYEKFKKESLNIAHRGPDSNSTINYHNKAFFCHYRLSIIDRSPSSNQPFLVYVKDISYVLMAKFITISY